jgi:hypothetical protein
MSILQKAIDIFKASRRRQPVSPVPPSQQMDLGETVGSDFIFTTEREERKRSEEEDSVSAEARKLFIIDAIVSTRKNQVWRYSKYSPTMVGQPGWMITTPSGYVPTPEVLNETVALLQALGNARFGWDMPPQRDIGEFFEACADSILTYAKVAVRFWSDGKAFAFGVIDPRYIYPVSEDLRPKEKPDAIYIRKPAPGCKDLKYEEFTQEELLLLPFRALYPFNKSPTCASWDLARSFEAILQHNASRFRTDRLPRGVLAILGNFAADTMKRLRRELQTLSEMPTTPFIQHPNKRYPNLVVLQMNSGQIQFIPIDPTPKDMDYPHALYQLATMICSRFGIVPEELGLDSPVRAALSEASPEFAIRSSQEKGLDPLLEQIADVLSHVIRHIGVFSKVNELMLYQVKITRWADFMTLQRITMMMQNGLMSPYEAYSILEKPLPFEHPYWSIPLPPTTWLPYVVPEIVAAQQQQAQASHGERKEE